MVKHDATDERSRKNEKDIESSQREIRRCRERYHELKGSHDQLVSYLDEITKE